MPTPIQRDSLTKGLEERYGSQRAGGAFDAKIIPEQKTDGFSNEFADGFTKGGLNTNLPKKDSFYIKGFDGTKYAPGGRR